MLYMVINDPQLGNMQAVRDFGDNIRKFEGMSLVSPPSPQGLGIMKRL